MNMGKQHSESREGQYGMEWTSTMREELVESHPVFCREYRMHTPMLERTFAIVRERVVTRRTGVYFYGSPRLGKSTCAKEVQILLSEEFPTAYVSLLSVRETQRPSESHLFKLLLDAQKHVLASRTDPSALFRNIKTDIQMKVASHNGSQFVLIIDEMQLLNEVDLRQLLALHNALDLERIKMTTVAFAQPEILHRVTALQTKRQTQIIARFLSEPLLFEGCASIQELRVLLKLYDEESEFPDGSGLSYTKFFFPEAFAHGFRLSKYAKLIWAALNNAIGSTKESGMPMEHVCSTIEHLLTAHRQYDAINFKFSQEDIEEAVDASNLCSFAANVLPGTD